MVKALKTLVILIFLFIVFMIFSNEEIINKNEELIGTNEQGRKITKTDDVDNIKPTLDTPEFWINKIKNVDSILMDENEIKNFNDENFSKIDCLYNLKEETTINEKELINLIQSISTIPKEDRYDRNGNIINNDFYNKLIDNLNINNIESENPLKYGVVVNRSEMRTFPTSEPVYKKPGDIEFDRFVETAIYSLEPVTIYNESKDGEWYFAKIYNYIGWLPKEDVAIGERDEIFNYLDNNPFIVVVDRQITIDNIDYDMGVKIPLTGLELDKEWEILLPERDEDGKLSFKKEVISKSNNFSEGYLSYTVENIITQAFKFKDEKYGWGGTNNTRDCSALIMDIYRTFGIKLPRNTSQQGMDNLGILYGIGEFLNYPGATLYMPGHTMIYLGEHEGEYYIIHQFAGYYEGEKEDLEYKEVMKTDVTTLDIKTSTGTTFLDNIYCGKLFISP